MTRINRSPCILPMDPTPPLTRRQQAIYHYLQEREARQAPPPTLDELCQALGLSSRGSLHKHIQALVEAGLVEPAARKQRGIRLAADDETPEETLPLLGRIAAGRPIEALPQPERIAVPAALRPPRPCYVLEVRGDSMIEDGILDGDWVVIEQCEQARDGAIVVALIDNAAATLKRIRRRPGIVTLQAANPGIAPLDYTPERVRIQGVLVGLMRRYR
jgi:repressor LexA